MINNLINATSIHKGGGLTYLFLLHKYFDKSDKLIFLDFRVKKHINEFKKAKIIFLKKGPFRNIRILYFRVNYLKKFYRQSSNKNNRRKFNELYLNGLPPLFRIGQGENKVHIFCQNRLLFENKFISNSINIDVLKTKIYLIIHRFIFNKFKRDSDILIVQTNSMKKLLIDLKIKNRIVLQDKIWGLFTKNHYRKIFSSNIAQIKNNKKIKFFKEFYKSNLIYFYPAYYYPHKNHLNLIKAFKKFGENNQISYKLVLTINNKKIKNIKEIKNIPNIIFINNISTKDIFNIYKYVDFLIYPSLTESFGLPLLEAKYNDVQIIASDLPYVYDICKPNLVFDPRSVNDILSKIKLSIKKNQRLTC